MKWLISVKDGMMERVTEELGKMGIKNAEKLDSIGVIIIAHGDYKITDLKKIDGVLNVEEERDLSI
ncbi:hypothetical protein [Pedobacter rhodius]|uniref:Uncharacterized protein n=1 Tax=Pedobacter rhodius TaxID=3004098 RepID=A0ABT4L0L5_9SPHI|nr:hypothetical protein [Pedobacter sp. SJ11]MCZ4223633.1 hypothetical protein [Pedobacter sp. SJ11]